MSEEIKYCRYCSKPLSPGLHGNRGHCPGGDCYSNSKRKRNKDNYEKNKKIFGPFQKAEKILGMFFKMYGSHQYIPTGLLEDAGMDWRISQGEVEVASLACKVIGNYCYCVFSNKTIKIWKVS